MYYNGAMTELAPIALFVYQRLAHTQKTIAALAKNPLASLSELHIYSDAAKTPQDQDSVNAVRAWLPDITGFKAVHITEAKTNLGLANSIIQGVTQLVRSHGKVIVVEDDLVTSPYFLTYMNDALLLYQDDPKVASIHGYALPLLDTLPETYFMRGADCWGWATWLRAWEHFEADGKKLLSQLEETGLAKLFDFDHTQANMQMLKDQIVGKNNSWAIRWHASAFLKNMLTLYPARSLVQNIGMDQSGENCGETDIFQTQLTDKPITLTPTPPMRANSDAYAAYVRFFKQYQKSLPRRIAGRIKRQLKSLLGV